jgi:hypothetical protein
MSTDTIKWIEINWKVLNTIKDNRSIIGSTEVVKVCCRWQSPPTRGSSWGPCGQSPVCKTKSSDKGQFLEALCGQSPLHKTKSFNKGQFLRPFVGKVHWVWQSPPTRGSSQGPCGQSPLCKKKSSVKPLKDKILIWQNVSYQVLDMSTQYNILYHTIQYIVFNKNFNISFETVCIFITKQFILSNNSWLF